MDHVAAAREAEREAKKPFAAYATASQVIGLVKMPLDGNAAKTMGLIAHPGPISALAVSGDGSLLATAGGADGTVNLWSVHPEVVDAAEAASFAPTAADEPLSTMVSTKCLPWVRQLGGGGPGTEMDELVDFFFYSQLRTQVTK